MKINELIKLVDALVEKRVKEILPKMLKEYKSSNSNTSMKSLLENDEFDDELSLDENTVNRSAKQEPKKIFAENSILHKLLNETANTPRPDGYNMYGYEGEDEFEDYPEMEINSPSDLKMPEFGVPSVNTKAVKLDHLKNVVERQSGNPEVASKLVQNYSSFLKKLDEKAKQKRNI